MNKHEVIDALLDHLQGTIESFQKSIDELKATSDMDETETKDPEDYSQQAESTDMQMRLQLQLDKVKHEYQLLKNFKNLTLDSVAHGAVFETEKRWFVVGVSILGASFKGKEIISFSTDAPIFHLIEGKKQGDSFKLGKEHYQILALS